MKDLAKNPFLIVGVSLVTRRSEFDAILSQIES